jgi:hypothetical protein
MKLVGNPDLLPGLDVTMRAALYIQRYCSTHYVTLHKTIKYLARMEKSFVTLYFMYRNITKTEEHKT